MLQKVSMDDTLNYLGELVSQTSSLVSPSMAYVLHLAALTHDVAEAMLGTSPSIRTTAQTLSL